MRVTLKALGVGALLGAFAAPAAAGTVTYDFTTESAATHEASLTDLGSGLTLTVEAYKVFDPMGADVDGDIRSNSRGWGVAENPGGGQVAGDEALALSFDSGVQLTEMVIDSNGNTIIDVFDYMTETFLGTIDFTGAGVKTVDLTALGFTGGSFVFQRGIGSTFFLSELSVAAIPLPGGAVLLLGGLGALGVARRRKA